MKFVFVAFPIRYLFVSIISICEIFLILIRKHETPKLYMLQLHMIDLSV